MFRSSILLRNGSPQPSHQPSLDATTCFLSVLPLRYYWREKTCWSFGLWKTSSSNSAGPSVMSRSLGGRLMQWGADDQRGRYSFMTTLCGLSTRCPGSDSIASRAVFSKSFDKWCSLFCNTHTHTYVSIQSGLLHIIDVTCAFSY